MLESKLLYFEYYIKEVSEVKVILNYIFFWKFRKKLNLITNE